MFKDPVQCPEKQRTETYHGDPSNLPGNQTISVHATEVLRPISCVGLEEGGWVGGNTWFGSVIIISALSRRVTTLAGLICTSASIGRRTTDDERAVDKRAFDDRRPSIVISKVIALAERPRTARRVEWLAVGIGTTS